MRPALPFPLCPCHQGLLYLYLLPVAAVAFTLLILTANVDPSGPSLRLTLRALEQFTPVPLANNPAPGDDAAQRDAHRSACMQPPSGPRWLG